jgi:DNA polymerase IV
VATIALDLLAGLRLERARVRLLGVGVSNLGEGDGARQLTLDTAAEEGPSPRATTRLGDPRWERVERIADSVAERFQGVAVSYAALLDEQQEDPDEVAPRREDRTLDDRANPRRPSGEREEPHP